jgi:hypothetical protein
MMEKHRLQDFDKRVKSKIFGPKIDKIRGKWIKLHKEEMCYVYAHQILL